RSETRLDWPGSRRFPEASGDANLPLIETHPLWMTALIFAPTVFALVILFVPRGQEEAMRWLATLGSAVTLAISIIMLTSYLEVPGVTTPGSRSSLEVRVDEAAGAQSV